MKKKHFDKKNEIKITGVNSSLLFVEKFHGDVFKIYTNKKNVQKLKMVTNRLKKTPEILVVEDSDILRLAKTEHHEGILVLAKKPEIESVRNFKLSGEKNHFLLLDDVSNPHNVGAILRSSANFGVSAVFVSEDYNPYSAATIRVSEGGVFSTKFISYKQLPEVAHFCKQNNVHIYATEVHNSKQLYSFEFSNHSLTILGAERTGISDDAEVIAQTFVTIPGTKNVESLNVSVAAGVILAEYFRQKMI